MVVPSKVEGFLLLQNNGPWTFKTFWLYATSSCRCRWDDFCNHVDSWRFSEGFRKEAFAKCPETCGEHSQHFFYLGVFVL